MELLLDVSQLEPCEPLQQTLRAAAALAVGDYLRVLHRREPHPLYSMLEQAGFAWRARAGGPAGFEIFIWRSGDPVAGSQVSSLTSASC